MGCMTSYDIQFLDTCTLPITGDMLGGTTRLYRKDTPRLSSKGDNHYKAILSYYTAK